MKRAASGAIGAALALSLGAARADDASALAPAAPDVELRDGASAIVGATAVAFDGIDEGLAWPALAKLAPKKGTIAITVGRDVPVKSVLRAVWTLRASDVHLQTKDASGALRVIDLAPKPATAGRGCHLAVFVAKDGSLRVAAPGGPRVVQGADAAGDLARALGAERATCPIRYVAFGAEERDATWGSVFDVAWSVARDKSAGDARVVLAEAVRGR